MADPFSDARRLYEERRIGARVGFGLKPALVVVDLVKGFTDPTSPLGADLSGVLEATLRLLTASRQTQVPTVFTTVSYMPGAADAGFFVRKMPSLASLVEGSEWTQVDRTLERRDSEPIVIKKYASAFFGTHLASLLTGWGTDTLIVVGTTTSGCIRATVVDGLQHGLRVVVPRECVGDRDELPHIANLFDIDSKYGDVVSLDETLAYLQRRPGHSAARLPVIHE